jgi:hypothetical protein
VQIAAALLDATVFWWVIERPSTRLSQKLGLGEEGSARRRAPARRPSAEIAAAARTQ